MPDLLLELFSEEIPARMQAKAADDLRKMVTDKLVAEGLVYEGAKAFVTPRIGRRDLPIKQQMYNLRPHATAVVEYPNFGHAGLLLGANAQGERCGQRSIGANGVFDQMA